MSGHKKSRPGGQAADEKTEQLARPIIPESAAEVHVLGGILLDNNVAESVELQVDDFQTKAHGIIYRTAREMLDEGDLVTLQTLVDRLRRESLIEKAGGAGYIASLTEETPSAALTTRHAEIVRKHARQRRATEKLSHALERVQAGEDVGELIGELSELAEAPQTGRKTGWTATELLDHDFPEITWIIPEILPAGLSVVAGAPKLGKSWLVLAIGWAVSVGGAVLGRIRVPAYEVLYLALEDTPRRLQGRLRKIQATPSDHLRIHTQWTRGAAGAREIRRWLKANPKTRLVVIDTWGKFRQQEDGNDYDESVKAADELKQIADEHDIAIVLVHHTKKSKTGEGGDFLEMLLGSQGLGATVDTGLVMKRARGNRLATLSITGRDVEEVEYALNFDGELGTWRLDGTTQEVQASDERQQIVDVLRELNLPLTPKQIAERVGKNANTIKNLVYRMRDEGTLSGMSGYYTLAGTRSLRSPVVSEEPHETTGTTQSRETTETTQTTDYTPQEDGEVPLFPESSEVGMF